MKSWKRTFAVIWTGQLFSTLSSAVIGYAVMFWLSIETGSAEILALSIVAALLPQLVLGLFTGVFIDRWNRKRTMIFADLFIALCTLFIAFLLYSGENRIYYFYLLLALRSVGAAFHIPAMQASIPLLAPEDKLMRIAGINNIIQSLSMIAGPALAALLISLFDLTWVLMIDVAGALIASISLLLVHIPDPEKKQGHQPHIIREMMEGFREIYHNAGLFWMFILAVSATFFIMPVAALFPLMTLNHFSGNTFKMSIIEIAWGIGMILGGALIGIPRLKTYKITLINLMYFLLGLTFLFSGMLSPSGFWYFAVICIFGGISMSVYSGSFNVVLQTMVEPAALGRVFSLYGSLTLLPSMIGLLATGYIADHIGIANSFIISGAVIGALGLLAFLVPTIKSMVKAEMNSER
jgi:DHA3 family macrolide efflux protein-like MFS transporter